MLRSLILITVAAFFYDCSSQVNSRDFNSDSTSTIASYTKDTFEVKRTWIEINDTEANLRYAFFIHAPVITDSVELLPTLPTKEWRYEHFRTIESKVGTVAAKKLTKRNFQHGAYGELQNKKYPVLIFGPGLGWLPSDYYELILPLIRKGIIVVTVFSHPVSKVIQFPDGTIDIIEKLLLDYNLQATILVSATKKIIELSTEEDNMLNGKIDLDRIIVGGHSVSGAAALLAATKFDAIKGIINLDGDVTEEIAQKTFSQPILYITSQPTQIQSAMVATWNEDRSEARRDKYFIQNVSKSRNWIRVKIPEMFHLDFLDAATLKNDIPSKLINNRFGQIESAHSSKLVSEAMIIFIFNRLAPESTWKRFNRTHTDHGLYIQSKK